MGDLHIFVFLRWFLLCIFLVTDLGSLGFDPKKGSGEGPPCIFYSSVLPFPLNGDWSAWQ